MTIVIECRNVNEAFYEAIWKLKIHGQLEDTRNGPCLVMPGPMVTEYLVPTERILWRKDRDANHVFHLMEALWMLAGRSDLSSILPFNSKFGQYFEEDGYMHGAYGYRWRHWFGFDQLTRLINELQNPETRRAVLTMWDPVADLNKDQRDIPCNTHIYFDRRGGKLNMTVCCRSNDMIFGAYGSNVVHFSILQELIAHAVGVPVGVYRQMSNNFHIYTESPLGKKFLADPNGEVDDLYAIGGVVPSPLLLQSETMQEFLADCEALFEGREVHTHFFNEVALPLFRAYKLRKSGMKIEINPEISDWHMGFSRWLENRNG